MTSQKRIVITGIGLVTPAGNSLEQYWSNITSGKSSLRKIANVNADDLSINLVGEVDNSYFDEVDNPEKSDGSDRALLLCRSAARRALNDAGIRDEEKIKHAIGLSLGSGAGPTQVTEEAYLSFAQGGPKALRPKTVTKLMFNSISAHIGIEFKLHGPQMTVASACASANMAMSRAIDMIRSGRSTMVLTGGVEMPLCRTVLSGWAAMRVCSTATDKEKCCLPFHKKRSGLALAEGAGIFLFEELNSALDRGAKIYAEVLGYGENNDGSHMTQPDSSSQAKCILSALQDSNIHPNQVDYVNAHGTGTELNDICESEAIKKAFGDHALKLAVSSTKSVIGHGLGASGALELPAILGAFQYQELPPTANLDEVDPRCTLDYVPLKSRKSEVNVAISNSFAFGGSNSVLVLKTRTV
jgi:3-oxoacyl-[acyl-carrier-protein] synthase II